MAYKLEIREKARAGTIAGFVWYEEKSAGLGTRFVNEIEETLNYISSYPLHFQVKYKDYREAVLKVFPYIVIYQVKGKTIIVSAVFSTKDDPGKKPKN